MSRFRMVSTNRLTIGIALSALAGGSVVLANFASAASGPSALDYAQCSNGPPGSSPTPDCAWINGILNTAGSQYHEDEVTPQRLLVSFPDKGAGSHLHSVTLRYLDRKGGIHAYDYLAAANATVADAITLRCLGIASGCPGGTASTTDVAADPAHVPTASGSYSDVVSTHMAGLTAAQKKLSVFGATFTTGTNTTTDPPAMSTPSHDNNCSGCTGDDYASTKISFVTSGNGQHNVQLLFGGHLAAGSQVDGWGTGLGASSVSGGPYHIKWAAADGASVGNRDNQIMSNAIIPIVAQGVTLTSTPDPAQQTVGDSTLVNANDQVTLVPDSTHAPTGTVTFDLYGPFTTGPGATDCVDPDPANSVDGNRITEETGVAVSTSSPYTATSSDVDLSGASPGIYQWVGHYVAGSDQFNLDADGTCGDTTEQVSIDPADPTGASSQTVTDTVSVSGFSPTGHVDWYAYTDCADPTSLVFSDVWVDDPTVDPGSANNVLDGSSQATSEAFTPSPAAGGTTYYWQVDYSGDTNNNPATIEACGDQQVTVQNAPTPPPTP